MNALEKRIRKIYEVLLPKPKEPETTEMVLAYDSTPEDWTNCRRLFELEKQDDGNRKFSYIEGDKPFTLPCGETKVCHYFIRTIMD